MATIDFNILIQNVSSIITSIIALGIIFKGLDTFKETSIVKFLNKFNPIVWINHSFNTIHTKIDTIDIRLVDLNNKMETHELENNKRFSNIEEELRIGKKERLKIIINSDNMDLKERLEAGEEYLNNKWNGATSLKVKKIKKEYEKEINI